MAASSNAHSQPQWMRTPGTIKSRRGVVNTGLLYLVAVILGLMFAFPFIWAIFTSLKTTQELYLFPPRLFPNSLQWNNYVEIWQAAPFGQFFLNSTVVAVLSVSGQVLSTSLVAYGFARFRFPRRDLLFLVVLSTLMLPPQVTVVPSFLLFKFLGWLDSFKPLVVPHWFAGSAFAIFLFRQFFLTIPKELDEAAKIDGANSLWIFFKIIVPLSTPVFITITVLAFLGSWNDFFAPLIYLNSTDNLTLPLGLAYFRRIGMSGGRATEHLLMAASMAMTLPCIVLFLVLQRYYVRGVTIASGSKG
jgi:ABC-type glycerol-3-phosphate transport system permease component